MEFLWEAVFAQWTRLRDAAAAKTACESPGGLSLLQRVQLQFGEAKAVHRLDMETSGVVVFARTDTAAAALCGLFAERQVAKRYVALLEGDLFDTMKGGPPMDYGKTKFQGRDGIVVQAPTMTVTLPLAAHSRRPLLQVVDTDKGRPATTDVTFEGCGKDVYEAFLSRAEYLTMVRLSPKTGRTHQLRVHMKALGHPICGDTLYGRGASGASCGASDPDEEGGGKRARIDDGGTTPDNTRPAGNSHGGTEATSAGPAGASNNDGGGQVGRLMLHAEELSFVHPSTAQTIKVVAPMPPEFYSWY